MRETEQPVERLLGHLFRHESGKMAAVLTNLLGSSRLDDVEDVVQDTLLKALEVWKFKGVPENPTAWLFTVARRKAIDLLRHDRVRINRIPPETNEPSWPETEHAIQDVMLRFMFASCHPSIPPESQIAFTLRTLGGLSTQEIAAAFMTSEETIAKRIYRAKEKFRQERITLEPPPADELPGRLDLVLKVLYLLFNEGYYSANPAHVMREDLCAEAMRLTHLLVLQPLTNQPQVRALLALMCFHASRFPARADDQNQIVLLEFQDRSKWSQDLIRRGLVWLDKAAEGERLTEYHVEAAIASVHAIAPTFAKTDWAGLRKLYDLLYEIKPTPAAALSRAIAIGYAESRSAGIEALKAIETPSPNQYYHMALGVFLADLGLKADAQIQFSTALHLTTSSAERQLLQFRLSSLKVDK